MNAHRPELTWLLAAGAFLLICTVLAIATWLVFKSGEQGKTKLNGAAGCAIGFGLAIVALLMAVVTTFAIAASAGRWLAQEFHENGGGTWRFDTDEREEPRKTQPAPRLEDGAHARAGVLSVVITGVEAGRVDELLAKARELAPGDLSSAVSIETSNGEQRSRVEIDFYVDGSQRASLRERLEAAWPHGEIEGGGKVEVDARDSSPSHRGDPK